jgi:hypothetical protein
MANDVTITFTADVSGLQRGMQQASSAVQATTSTLRAGADQINANFGSLSQLYASNAARKLAVAQTSSSEELAIARQNEQAQYDTALNGLKEQSSLIEERAQMAQISRQDELNGLLALESQREAIERQYLQFQQNTYQQGSLAYTAAQGRMEETANQSALRRVEIERGATQQISSEYKSCFEKIASSVSSSIMGMITGHMRLREAARNILTQIVQSFIQARLKMVADWLAGIATETAATQASETEKTGAVAAGTAARTGLEATASSASMASTIGAMLKSITASAGEAFAGVFGFLSPVMGPAAAGPAAGAEAAVLSVGAGLASFASGAWELPSDMVAQVHQGEMIVPAGPAATFRSMMEGNSGVAGTVHVHHAVNFNVSAMDSRSVRQFFNDHGRTIMRAVNESVRTGSHLGLSKLGTTA